MEMALSLVLLYLPAVVPMGYPVTNRKWVSPQHIMTQPKSSWQRPQYNPYNQYNPPPPPPPPPQKYPNMYPAQYRPGYPRNYPSAPQYNPQPQVQQYQYRYDQKPAAVPPQNGPYSRQYPYGQQPSWAYPPQRPPQYQPKPYQPPSPQLLPAIDPVAANFIEGLDLPTHLEFQLTTQLSNALRQPNPSDAFARVLASIQSLTLGTAALGIPTLPQPAQNRPGSYGVPVIG